MDFFGSHLKTFPLEITILAAVKLIVKKEEIKKNIRTWGCRTSCFWVMALWRRVGKRREGGHKFLFSTGQVFCQKLLNHTLAVISLKCFRIIAHCYAAWFSIKKLFCKINIFYSLWNWIWDKTKWWFWKYIKNKGKFSNFYYVSSYLHLKGFARKRDFVISQKTANVTDLIKT